MKIKTTLLACALACATTQVFAYGDTTTTTTTYAGKYLKLVNNTGELLHVRVTSGSCLASNHKLLRSEQFQTVEKDYYYKYMLESGKKWAVNFYYTDPNMTTMKHAPKAFCFEVYNDNGKLNYTHKDYFAKSPLGATSTHNDDVEQNALILEVRNVKH